MTDGRPLLGLPSVLDSSAPAQRLAAFRITTSVFVVAYLLIRLPMFVALADRAPAAFDGVGIMALLGRPLQPLAVDALIVVALASGAASIVGWRHRVVGPVFALAVLLLTSYRSSWGQLLHFENLFVLHLIVLSVSPAADAWSLDAKRLHSAAAHRAGDAYGWPLGIACMCVAITYFIAGVAKLRYGGVAWVFSDTLRNHVAYSAVRLDVLGGTRSPLAASAVRHAWLFPPLALASVVVELAAPLTLFVARTRTIWVACAWAMHIGIFALMLVGFPYPLFLAAFAPFFPIERLARHPALRRLRRSRLLRISP